MKWSTLSFSPRLVIDTPAPFFPLKGEENLTHYGIHIAVQKEPGTLFYLEEEGLVIAALFLEHLPDSPTGFLPYFSFIPSFPQIETHLKEGLDLVLEEGLLKKLRYIEIFAEKTPFLEPFLKEKGFTIDTYPSLQRFSYHCIGYDSPWLHKKLPSLPLGFSLVSFEKITEKQLNTLSRRSSIAAEVALSSIKKPIDKELSFALLLNEKIVGYSVLCHENPQTTVSYYAMYMEEGIQSKVSFLHLLLASTQVLASKASEIPFCFFSVSYTKGRTSWHLFIKKYLSNSADKTTDFYIYLKKYY